LRIRSALGDRALLVEHVGSTSVPHLIAKAVIDVVLEVAASTDELTYVPALVTAGYDFELREPAWYEHRLFKRLEPRVNLHVFSHNSCETKRMLRFRDRLRSSAADRELYARAKRELAQREWKCVQDYADAKTEIVSQILMRAPR
jgi:GrpB-like predicted nucleotidyltransferase (UPF0157 family)